MFITLRCYWQIFLVSDVEYIEMGYKKYLYLCLAGFIVCVENELQSWNSLKEIQSVLRSLQNKNKNKNKKFLYSQ